MPVKIDEGEGRLVSYGELEEGSLFTLEPGDSVFYMKLSANEVEEDLFMDLCFDEGFALSLSKGEYNERNVWFVESDPQIILKLKGV